MKPALRVYLRDNGILAGRFFQIKKHLGVTSDTEVLRLLINRYWNEHREEFQPTYRYFNVNDDGVTILDLENNQTRSIYASRRRVSIVRRAKPICACTSNSHYPSQRFKHAR